MVCGCRPASRRGDLPELAGGWLVMRWGGAHHAGPSNMPACSRPPALRDPQPRSWCGAVRSAFHQHSRPSAPLARLPCTPPVHSLPPCASDVPGPGPTGKGKWKVVQAPPWQLRGSLAAVGLVPLRLPCKPEAAGAGLGLPLPFPPPLSAVLSLTTSAHSLPYSQSKPEAQRGQETQEGHTASKGCNQGAQPPHPRLALYSRCQRQ